MGTEALLIAGGATSIVGGLMSAQSEAEAAERNADAIREQARFNEFVAAREQDIFRRDSDIALGQAVSAIARSGVDFSGSLLMQFASSKSDVEAQLRAMKIGAARNSRALEFQAKESEREAKNIRIASLFSAASTGMSTYGSVLQHRQRVNSDALNQLNQQKTNDILINLVRRRNA